MLFLGLQPARAVCGVSLHLPSSIGGRNAASGQPFPIRLLRACPDGSVGRISQAGSQLHEMPARPPMVLQVHDLVEKASIVREGWNGYNVMHDTASRVAALDLGFLPGARSAAAPPPKFVYLLGADDFAEQDIPSDAFVVYQVGPPALHAAAAPQQLGPASGRLACSRLACTARRACASLACKPACMMGLASA